MNKKDKTNYKLQLRNVDSSSGTLCVRICERLNNFEERSWAEV